MSRLLHVPLAAALATLALLLMAPTARADQGVWSALDTPRWITPVATLDRTHQQLVVFGANPYGSDEVYAAPLDAPTAWSRHDVPGPGPVLSALVGSTNDVRNGRLFACGTGFEGCWRYDSAEDRWVRLGDGLARDGAALAFDPTRHLLFAFGGAVFASHTRIDLNDVQYMDADTGGTWQVVTTTGTSPLGREFASAIFDEANQRLLFFGGKQTNGVIVDETWALLLSGSSATWEFLAPGGPAPQGRQRTSLAIDAAQHRMLAFGGDGGALFPDTWALDLSQPGATWTSLSTSHTPFALTGAASAFDSVGARWYVAGGAAGPWRRDLQILATTGTPDWAYPIADAAGPPAGELAAAVIDRTRASLVAIEAAPPGSGTTSAVWTRTLAASGAWTRRGTISPGVNPGDDEVVLDAANDRLLILRGGVDPMRVDALPLAGALTIQSVFTTGAAPSQRTGFTAALDSVRQRVLVFGGGVHDTLTHFADPDIFAFDLASGGWSKLTVSGAAGVVTDGLTLLVDAAHDAMLAASPLSVQAFSFTSGQWSAPVARADDALATDGPAVLDPRRGRILWRQITADGSRLLTFTLADSTFAVLPTIGPLPPPNFGHALAVDPGADRLWDPSSLGTWVLGYSNTATYTLDLVEQALVGTTLHLRWRSPDHSVTHARLEVRRDGGAWSADVALPLVDQTDFVCVREIDAPGLWEFRLAVDTDTGVRYFGATSLRANAAPPFDPHRAVVRARTNPSPRTLALDVFDPPADFQTQDRVELYDISGRRLAVRPLTQASGWQSVDLGAGLTLRPGVYLVRLGLFGRRNVDTRVVVL